MAFKYIYTDKGVIAVYQSGDKLVVGSSMPQLISLNPQDIIDFNGTATTIYNMSNGSRIEAYYTSNRTTQNLTMGVKFYDSFNEEVLSYSQSWRVDDSWPDNSYEAICLQWFMLDDTLCIGANYFTYGTQATGADIHGNNGFAPNSWIVSNRDWGMYNNPTSYYITASTFGDAIHDAPFTPNPYERGGISTEGGGEGTFTIINDDIDFPSTPLASAANANFISIWTPTLEQVQTLAKWLWNTDPLKINFWQKLIQNPLELIFSLSIMPVPIFHTDDEGTATEDELVALNDTLALGWQETGIRMDWVPEQYVTLDMGTIYLEEVWGAFLDYEPYTKIDIYLPYIGVKQLDTNDCMPRNISLRYVIDLATGTCVAMIKCDNSVYYHFSGNCASQIPITVNQCQEIVRGLMTMVVGAATIGVGVAGVAGSGVTSALGIGADKGLKMAMGGAATMGAGGMNAAKGVTVSRSGTVSCAAGLMGIQTPYLIISRPRQAMPDEQQKYTGYPSFITEDMNELEGYTEVQIIHLHEMSCMDSELDEIDSLLRSGVIF